MKFILNFMIFSSQNGSMNFNAPLFKYFPIPSTDWVSQIITIRNIKINQTRKQNRNRKTVKIKKPEHPQYLCIKNADKRSNNKKRQAIGQVVPSVGREVRSKERLVGAAGAQRVVDVHEQRGEAARKVDGQVLGHLHAHHGLHLGGQLTEVVLFVAQRAQQVAHRAAAVRAPRLQVCRDHSMHFFLSFSLPPS